MQALGSPKRAVYDSRKRLSSPFRKLSISTSPSKLTRSDSISSDFSDPGTPFRSDRYGHTTYTTYVKGTKYTRYVIRKLTCKPFDLDQRGHIYQTTFKTMKLNTNDTETGKRNKPTWYTHVHIWMKDKGNNVTGAKGTPPSTPRLRAISDLERGQISPRRFSLDGLSSPL